MVLFMLNTLVTYPLKVFTHVRTLETKRKCMAERGKRERREREGGQAHKKIQLASFAEGGRGGTPPP